MAVWQLNVQGSTNVYHVQINADADHSTDSFEKC